MGPERKQLVDGRPSVPAIPLGRAVYDRRPNVISPYWLIFTTFYWDGRVIKHECFSPVYGNIHKTTSATDRPIAGGNNPATYAYTNQNSISPGRWSMAAVLKIEVIRLVRVNRPS